MKQAGYNHLNERTGNEQKRIGNFPPNLDFTGLAFCDHAWKKFGSLCKRRQRLSDFSEKKRLDICHEKKAIGQFVGALKKFTLPFPFLHQNVLDFTPRKWATKLV